MTASAVAAASFCGITFLLHIITTIVAAWRCRSVPTVKSTIGEAPAALPPVSIVRPICGLDPFLEETLRTSFELAYPTYELIFCIASTRDPAIPIVQNLMAMHRHVDAQLLVGDDRISQNPKLNNCVKGWRAAKYDWIVLADSNVLMPVDDINRLLDAWEPDTGLVCSPPVGCRAMGFWAGLECAFLNTYQVRVQYFADALGFGFAQGKTMLWRRAELEAAGGIGALATEIAEDAASTKIVRAASLRVRLATPPFEQPLGRRRIAEVWRRQTRWARFRRSSPPDMSPAQPTYRRSAQSRRCRSSGAVPKPRWRRQQAGSRGRYIHSRPFCVTCSCRCCGLMPGSAPISSGAATR